MSLVVQIAHTTAPLGCLMIISGFLHIYYTDNIFPILKWASSHLNNESIHTPKKVKMQIFNEFMIVRFADYIYAFKWLLCNILGHT